jgi:hypothetical protein
VNAKEVAEVAQWLDSLGIEYVVVGGSAIELKHSVGTKDVDVLIAVGDWAPLDRALDERREATPLESHAGSIRGTRLHLGTQVADVEFISGQPFCGKRDPDDFIRFVRSRHSKVHGGVRFAEPAVVWYMRLSTDDWEIYALKIEQDLRAGVPADTLDRTLALAAHFGVRPKIADRVAFLRRTLALFEPVRTERSTPTK